MLRPVVCCLWAICSVSWVVQAAQAPEYVPEDHRPPLFFRETFPLPKDKDPDRGVNWHLNPSPTPLASVNFEFKEYGETKAAPGPHNTKAPDHAGNVAENGHGRASTARPD